MAHLRRQPEGPARQRPILDEGPDTSLLAPLEVFREDLRLISAVPQAGCRGFIQHHGDVRVALNHGGWEFLGHGPSTIKRSYLVSGARTFLCTWFRGRRSVFAVVPANTDNSGRASRQQITVYRAGEAYGQRPAAVPSIAMVSGKARTVHQRTVMRR